MASPIKSLSLREDAEGAVCLHKKLKTGIYKGVADFWFEIDTFVKFEGNLNAHSGYLFNVHKLLAENKVSKKCFVPCRDMDAAKKILNALNNVLADCGGVFWEDIKDWQIQSLLKKMTRDFFLQGGKTHKAVTVVGRQSVEMPKENYNPEADVYVFNESVQMNGKGEMICDEEITHVWMDSYAYCVSIEDKDVFTNEFKVEIDQVIGSFSWLDFLNAALPVFTVNFFQSIMMMAGAIACFHYPYSIQIAGKN